MSSPFRSIDTSVMDADQAEPSSPTGSCHVVAIPYPGRGHVNPMMSLCKLLVSRHPDILVTFVVTEEWLGFIGSESKPENIRYGTVPNVIPSEIDRAKDFPGFLEAVFTKMEAPFEKLLDQLQPPVSAIIADTYVVWAIGVGNRRNIPVASLFPMSPSVFTVCHHFHLLVENGHFPVDLSERGYEHVDYIPGLPTTTLADLPTIFTGNGSIVYQKALKCVSNVAKAQYLLFTSVYNLESQVIDALKPQFPFPIYTVGPTIPYFHLNNNNDDNNPNYITWLNSQPNESVLYVSLGSFLSVSSTQMDEIVDGIRNSAVKYLFVTRGDTSRFGGEGDDGCNCGGMVVPWCDQLRVLRHASIGGFWTHCGLNSTLEAVYAGVPMLTFPIFMDQVPNSKQIVEDWGVGWRVAKKRDVLVTRDEISELVRKFMDLGSNERKKMKKRANELREICLEAIAESGSSMKDIDAFLKDISQARN